MSKTRRRLKRTAIIGLEIIAGATLGFLVLMGVTIWRLSEGPIEINFLSKTIEEALSDPGRGLEVGIGTTQLTWEGWSRGLDIHLVDVIARNSDGDVIADVHDMTVAFSLQALARGELAPTRLEVIAPSIFLSYHADGSISVGQDQSRASAGSDASDPADAAARAADDDEPDDDQLMDLIVEELMRAPESDRRFGDLRSFEVRDANLQVHDEVNNAVWETPGASLIMRRDANGLNLEGALAIKLAQDVTFFDISGYFNRAEQAIRLSVGFDRITPSLWAGQSPYLADFVDFDLPISGQVNTILRADESDFDLRLNVAFPDSAGSVAASGHFSLADQTVVLDADVAGIDLAELAHRLPWLAPFTGFNLMVDGQSQLLITPDGVQSLGFSFQSGEGNVVLPDQFDDPLDVISAELEGAMAGGGEALDIGRADILFGTSKFTGSATAFARGDAGYDLSVQGRLVDMPVADIGRYWPSGLAGNARGWVQNRLPGGLFDRIDLDIYGFLDIDAYTFDPGETRMDFAFSDVSLLYIEEMPALTGMSGTGSYDGSALVINVAEGSSTFDLAGGEGLVVIDGFENELARAHINATLTGDVRDHFRMLDHEPLSFIAAYGIAPASVAGQGTVEVDLAFDLAEVVTLDSIEVTVNAALRDATIPGMVADRALTGAALTIAVNNQSMRVEGNGKVNGTAVEFTRQELFAGGDYAAQSTMRGLFEAPALADFGLDVQDWVVGPVGFAARFTEYRDNTERADIAMDLSSASMEMPALVWSKAPGVPASAEFSLALHNSVPFAIERFDVNAGDLTVAGRVQFAEDGAFRALDLLNLSLGRTQVAGRVETVANNGLAIRLEGAALDLQPMMDDESEETSTNRTRVLTITAALGRVWISDDGFANQVNGTIQLVGPTWFSGQINMTSTTGTTAQVVLEPTDSGRFLRVTADDAGGLLRDLDLVDSVRGGRLVLSARFRDNEPGRPLVGDLDVSDFRLVDAPILARIISIAGVTGILDALQGAGIGFVRLATTFRMDGDVIEFREGRMVGASLGITFDGSVDIDNDLIDLRGAVAPAYALNGILSDIPLIGDVLVGGEGEGIFAVTYQASGNSADPQVAVNPLSALTPGVLRNIFPGG